MVAVDTQGKRVAVRSEVERAPVKKDPPAADPPRVAGGIRDAAGQGPSPTPTPATARDSRERFNAESGAARLRTELQSRIDADGKNDRFDLRGYSERELQGLVALGRERPDLARQVRGAVTVTLNSAETLRELPNNKAFQQLVIDHVATGTDAATKDRLKTLVRGEVEEQLDEALDGKKGDQDLEKGIAQFQGSITRFAENNPAYTPQLEGAVRGVAGDNQKRMEKIAEADDSFLEDLAGGLGSAIRGLGEVGAWLPIPNPLSPVLEATGLPNPTGDITRGAANGVAGIFEGGAYLISHPKQGGAALWDQATHPWRIAEDYWNSAKENGPGYVAGELAVEALALKGAGKLLGKLPSKIDEVIQKVKNRGPDLPTEEPRIDGTPDPDSDPIVPEISQDILDASTHVTDTPRLKEKRRDGVFGGHMKDEFESFMDGQGEITERIPVDGMPGVEIYRYQLYKDSPKGTGITDELANKKFLKTVFDPKVWSQEQIGSLMNDLFGGKKPEPGKTQLAVERDGWTYRGFYKPDGTLDSFGIDPPGSK